MSKRLEETRREVSIPADDDAAMRRIAAHKGTTIREVYRDAVAHYVRLHRYAVGEDGQTDPDPKG